MYDNSIEKKALEALGNSTSDLGYELEAASLEDTLSNTIKTNALYTLGIKYEMGTVIVTTVMGDSTKVDKFSGYSESLYNDFCEKYLNIDLDERYQCSKSNVIEGVKCRTYALMKPFSDTPSITISTTKAPPSVYNDTVSDEVLNEVIHSNFIIVGGSGSGKTYLTNYMLSKHIKESERIALIEEFNELIPPNDLTTSIVIPPAKPGEVSLLKYMTEQSNLMRLDAVYVGEIKGAEAWPFVVNLASGTRGGCTMHGDSVKQALNRLRALCRMSCDNDDAIDEFISKSIQYVVVMKKQKIEAVHRLKGTHIKGIFATDEVAS